MHKYSEIAAKLHRRRVPLILDDYVGKKISKESWIVEHQIPGQRITGGILSLFYSRLHLAIIGSQLTILFCMNVSYKESYHRTDKRRLSSLNSKIRSSLCGKKFPCIHVRAIGAFLSTSETKAVVRENGTTMLALNTAQSYYFVFSEGWRWVKFITLFSIGISSIYQIFALYSWNYSIIGSV